MGVRRLHFMLAINSVRLFVQLERVGHLESALEQYARVHSKSMYSISIYEGQHERYAPLPVAANGSAMHRLLFKQRDNAVRLRINRRATTTTITTNEWVAAAAARKADQIKVIQRSPLPFWGRFCLPIRGRDERSQAIVQRFA